MVRDVTAKNFTFLKPSFRQLMILTTAIVMATLGIKGYQFSQIKSKATKISASQVITPQIKTVTALGRIEPKGKVIKLSAPSSSQVSRIEKLLVKEGDKVKAGQVIAILDNRPRLQAAYQETQAAVKLAQINLEKVQSGAKIGEIDAQKADISRIEAQKLGDETGQRQAVARLEAEWQGETTAQQATINKLLAELKNAQVEQQRYQQLSQDGAISQSLFDSKRLSVDTLTQQLSEARANLNRIDSSRRKQISEAKIALTRINATGSKQVISAQATLNKIAEVRPVDIAAAKAEVSRAIAAAQQAKANLEQTHVKAPQNGVIFEIYTRAGEVVSNNGIVELGQINQMNAVVEVYQSDVSKIRPQQQVKISSNSIPGQLQGKVDWVGWKVQRQNVINSDPSENIDSRVVEVYVQLDEASSKKAAKFTNLQVKAVISL